jgi:hypothetical protein
VQLPATAGDILDMNVSHVVKGAPNDACFEHSVLDTMLPNCNTMLRTAQAHPVVRESTKWEDRKVTH